MHDLIWNDQLIELFNFFIYSELYYVLTIMEGIFFHKKPSE